MILGYTRVSTQEQASDNSTSLQEQERKIRAIAQLRGAKAFDVAIYSDPNVSGSTPLLMRKAGEQLLKDAAPGDVIVSAKLDRLFRDSIDALQTLGDLKKRKVDVILLDVSHEPLANNPVAELFFTMLAAFATFERKRIAERMEDGREGKRRRQGHLGGVAPYGYRVIGEKKESRLVPVDEEQEAIRVIADVWQRWTPAEAVREVTRRGLRDRAGSEFRIVQLKRIYFRYQREHAAH